MEQKINRLVEINMEAMGIPGASIAIVRSNAQTLYKGFGYRDRNRALAVTPDTFFLQGSVTKTFTALGAALLADNGVLDLDIPIVQYLPWFALSDNWATIKVTPRDFLAHRSGFGEHDSAWFEHPDISRFELIRGMRDLLMSSELRTVWDYSNHGYVLIGLLVEELIGMSWEQFVIDRILRPIGMMQSSFGNMLKPGNETAEAFYDEPIPDAICEVPYALNPAGGLKSSAREMARWIRLLLDNGSIDGMQIIPKTVIDETQCPQIVLPWAADDEGEYGLNGCYCLGWFREVYRKHLHLFHEGRYPGFSSMLSLYPKQELAIVVMCNRSSRFPMTVARTIADVLLGDIL